MTDLAQQAREIARRDFGLDGGVRALPGEIDHNYRVSGARSDRALKLVAASRRPVAELIAACLDRVATADIPARTPTLIPPVSPGDRPGRAGASHPARPPVVSVAYAGAPHFACAMTWIHGTPLAELGPTPPALLAELGAALAHIDGALAGLEHPALERDFAWRMESAPETIRDHLAELRRGSGLVEATLERALARLAPVEDALPRAVVHGDANGHNVLVRSSSARPLGIVDFGDAARSWRVSEVAIAAAYAMMDRPDPLEAACAIARGYSSVAPLGPEECAAIPPLAALRLCLSLTVQARRMREDPGNRYLAVSREPARRLLRALADSDWRIAERRIRDACGHPSPTRRRSGGWPRRRR